ncbi:MAG: CotH kinase family protein, partial [bacterium]
MTGRLLCCLAVLASAGAGGFYDADRVGEVRLTFAQPNWDWILDSLYAAGEEGRLVGTATVDGVRFDSVGVRYKGASSYNPSRRKNPLNIKLDHVRPGQVIDGHGTLRLANVYKDPSFVREVLAYEIARRYMPAGRANFVNVRVNDTLIGLYTNNEDPDKRFMREHYYGDENARFKGRLTDSSQMIGWKYLGPDPESYRHYFELDSDSGWTELVAFLDTFNNRPAAMGRVLNVDRHLWMLSFDALLVNLDAPINMPQNYYLYRDPSGRFNPIVWDLNESFGAYRDLNGTGILSVTQMQQLDPFLRQGDTNYPIAGVVLDDARLRRMYAAHLKTMMAETFANNWYRDRALAVQDIIDPHVQADRNKFYTYNDFVNNITRSVGTGPLAIVGLTELMGPRVTWILSRPEFAAPGPTIGDVSVAPARPVPGSSARFEVTVTGADSVFLGWRQSPAAAFERVAMASAGGGAYGATVRLGAGDVEYYVYAEDSDAGTFAPPRAEYESYSLPVTGDVVVNELMALNVSTARDPAGDFDDWIELYNNSDRAVSLDGFLLTDDSTDILKWQFPDTTIPARGFV